MNIPKFTADASLMPLSRRHYSQTTSNAGENLHQHVMPQMMMSEKPWLQCYAECRAAGSTRLQCAYYCEFLR